MTDWANHDRQVPQPQLPATVLDPPHDEIVTAELVDEPQRTQRRILVPAFLFFATCLTTYDLGGWMYAGPLMLTLLAHEFGHFFQSVRYGVPASLPLFIPVPAILSPFGTMGAVILMRGKLGNRKSLFDVAVSGPLAGLGPALVCSIVGLNWSHVDVVKMTENTRTFGEPLLFKWLIAWKFGELPPNHDVFLHPLAFAGWVGIFVTSLNLMPIGQLDGGHILYALLRKKAHYVATAVLYGGALVAVLTATWMWALMILILMAAGPRHPPTEDDEMPLGLGRTILGWATLAFLIIGFTPVPLKFGP